MKKNVQKLSDLSCYLRIMAKSGVETYDVDAFPEFFESIASLLETIALDISNCKEDKGEQWMRIQ